MRVDLDALYHDTVTIINRLDAKDAGVSSDVYKVTVLHDCMWIADDAETVTGTGTVDIGTTFKVQVPKTADYRPYHQWKNDQEGFTVRAGDYVVLGEVTEEVTASTVKKVVAKHEPDSFIVQHFRDATKPQGLTYSPTGVMRFAEMLYIEG